LELSENDPLCLVDLAMAYRSNNQFKKAQEIFERALELPRKQIGFRHRYVLFQYGMTLEELSLYQEANEAYTDACELNMKSACQKLDKGRSRKS
ncbi:MAG: tetratricopeptide repeat protein, partial [Pseudomonadota bacterium]